MALTLRVYLEVLVNCAPSSGIEPEELHYPEHSAPLAFGVKPIRTQEKCTSYVSSRGGGTSGVLLVAVVLACLGSDLEKEMITHFIILSWRIPWTEEPGRPWSIGSQRVRHD